VDAEWNYRTTHLPDQNDEDELIGRLDRLSYVRGGDRFDPDRREYGRFLQHGMPEFGVLDGYEFGRHNSDGEYSGWSVGLMPEPNAEQQTGEDAQIAFNRRWTFGDFEGVSVDTGYQKTFHKGKSDRDLIVAKFVRLPRDDWDFYGTAWVDLYSSRDDVKGSGAELTQLLLSTNRHYPGGSGLGLTYSSFRFPELRRKEFAPLDAAELADDETQRLWIDAWKPTSSDTRLTGRVGTWRDEDETGGDFEAGLEVEDWVLDRSLATLTLFGTNGKFSDAGGVRVAYSLYTATGHWDLFSEVSRRRQDNFTSDLQDLPLYRLRLSHGFRMPRGWDVNLYAEGKSWQEEHAVSVGFYMQRSF
jgi:hypothetical protein